MPALDGTSTKQLYQYSRNYPNQGGRVYFNTYQTYSGEKGGINPSTLKTYLLVEKDTAAGKWYKAAELGVDGKWIPLTEKQSGILVNTEQGKPGTFAPVPNASDKLVLGVAAVKDLSTGGKNSLRYQAINNAKFLLKNGGKVSENEVNTAFNVSSNIAAPGHSDTPGLFGNPVSADSGPQDPKSGAYNPEQANIIQKLAEDYAENTRTDYPPGKGKDLRYPLNLNANQDSVQFTILEYQPSGIIPRRPTSTGLRTPSSNIDKKIKTTITMAIPGGISDRNTVDWNPGNMSYFAAGAADIVNQFLVQGTDAATQSANKAVTNLLADSDTLTAFAGATAAAAALNIATPEQILTRQFGAAPNPNLELLFSSPSLRSFSFNFKMSPRSENEARTVRTIIRYFKQAMSVKRTKSSLLLKSPHTFRIKYMNGNREHPYLNKFKECALTECVVNYTPDGTYMTYDDPEPSMTSYEMQLTFQELEPVFDDEYGASSDNQSPDYNTDPQKIGY